MSFVPTTEDIQKYVNSNVDYWLERVRYQEPEFTELKKKPGFEFLEQLERHVFMNGMACGVATVTGFTRMVLDETNRGNEKRDQPNNG